MSEGALPSGCVAGKEKAGVRIGDMRSVGLNVRVNAGVDRVAGLTWRPVTDTVEVAAALAHGTEQRATSATAMNATSSRSHAVLSVRLAFADGGRSLLHLVDLAGTHVTSCQQNPLR